MDKTDRLRDYGLAFLLYEQGLGVCGYELIRKLFIFVKLILNSYLILQINSNLSARRINNESILYIALDGETTNFIEFTNFFGVLLLIQQFVNSIKFVVSASERNYIFVVSLIRLTAKLQFTTIFPRTKKAETLKVSAYYISNMFPYEKNYRMKRSSRYLGSVQSSSETISSSLSIW